MKDSATPETRCPLCFERTTTRPLGCRKTYVHCASCGEFVIAAEAVAYVSRMSLQGRQRFAAEVSATTAPDFLYCISCPKDDPPTDLRGEALPRDVALRP